MLDKHLSKNNIKTHNNKSTWHQSTGEPSIVDHFYSTCPSKITNVETINNINSDHGMLSAIYNSVSNFYQPKFLRVRNNKLFTTSKLCYEFNKN